MEIKVKKGSKLITVNLLISPDGEVLAYSAHATYHCPYGFRGTPAEFIKDNGRDVTGWLDVTGWREVSTKNPYGDYEKNCELHALGAIDMDDPYRMK